MGTDYILELHGDYLHVKLSEGYDITPEGIQKQWSEIIEVCKQTNCRRVLAEGIIAKRSMTTVDAFQSGDTLAKPGLGLSVALCLYGHTPDDLSRFFENVAANRGARVKFFSNKSEALRWLGIDPDKQ